MNGPDRLLLLRHASAGERERWTGDDRLRPLDAQGRAAAERLPDHLADHLPDGLVVVSSPLLRCTASVVPLAAAAGVEVTTDDRLAETASPWRTRDRWPDAAWYGARGLAAVEEAGAAPGSTLVVCSHGEVLPALLAAFVGRYGAGSVVVAGDVDLSAKALPKGAAWVVDRADGEVTVALVPAPAVTPRDPPERT